MKCMDFTCVGGEVGEKMFYILQDKFLPRRNLNLISIWIL